MAWNSRSVSWRALAVLAFSGESWVPYKGCPFQFRLLPKVPFDGWSSKSHENSISKLLVEENGSRFLPELEQEFMIRYYYADRIFRVASITKTGVDQPAETTKAERRFRQCFCHRSALLRQIRRFCAWFRRFYAAAFHLFTLFSTCGFCFIPVYGIIVVYDVDLWEK